MTELERLKKLNSVGVEYIAIFYKKDKSCCTILFDKDCQPIPNFQLDSDLTIIFRLGKMKCTPAANRIYNVGKLIRKLERC